MGVSHLFLKRILQSEERENELKKNTLERIMTDNCLGQTNPCKQEVE